MAVADVSVTRPAAVAALAPIDFEPVDFATARRAIEEPPPGVKPLPPIDWPRRRRPQADDEQRLSEGTRTWAESLPEGQRPRQLLAAFPRVANRLGAGWHDRQARIAMLDELLVDRRGGRKGFPSAVSDEIAALRDLADHR